MGANTLEKVTAVYHGHKLKVKDTKQLISLVEQLASTGGAGVLNLAMTDSTLQKFGESGLQITIIYQQKEKKLCLEYAGYQNETVVEKIYIMKNESETLMVVCFENTGFVCGIYDSELEKICNCIEF